MSLVWLANLRGRVARLLSRRRLKCRVDVVGDQASGGRRVSNCAGSPVASLASFRLADISLRRGEVSPIK